jgi:hypothetical protein
VYLTHGFRGYYEIDGRRTAALSEITRDRYRGKPPAPYEDGGISFFLRDRMPKQITVSFYSPVATKVDIYLNLDLDAYDPPGKRPSHQVASIAAKPGWQTETIHLPPTSARRGLNKLGFKVDKETTAYSCVLGTESCAVELRDAAKSTTSDSPKYYATVYEQDAGPLSLLVFVESLQFAY